MLTHPWLNKDGDSSASSSVQMPALSEKEMRQLHQQLENPPQGMLQEDTVDEPSIVLGAQGLFARRQVIAYFVCGCKCTVTFESVVWEGSISWGLCCDSKCVHVLLVNNSIVPF